jgi:hypothetical protein
MSELFNPMSADDIVEGYLSLKIEEQEMEMEDANGKLTMEQIGKLVKTTNQYLNLYCGPDRELYDEVKYNLIVNGALYSITRGKLWDTEP